MEDGKYFGHCMHDETRGWADFKIAIKFDSYKIKTESPIVAESILDLNAFFNASDSTASSAVSVQNEVLIFRALCDQFRGPVPPMPESLVPACGLFPKKTICTIASDAGVGKSTLMCAGILIPMMRGEPVLGQFPMPIVKTFYIQSDSAAEFFMNRILVPYGWQQEFQDTVSFFHTQSSTLACEHTVANVLTLIKSACQDGYKLIVIDNKTSLFLGMVYDLKHANVDSLRFVEVLKKLAMQFDVCVVIVEHMRKRMQLQWELVSLQDVLGSGSKLVEQVIGLNARYDDFKAEEKGAHHEYTRREGEGVVVPLKNAEGLAKLKYEIIKDEPYDYLSFEPFEGLLEKKFERVPTSATPESVDKLRLLIRDNYKNGSEFTYADLIKLSGMH
jgi:hypothetical protein